ncbi:MAG TPA: UDP-N-acetylmuramoyl-L-alanine--D-glutamate ligase [Gemmatimonadales bacterium]|nr:UDP-N-acetylmuramoyl-L-alanine--D-glutamate ligase [Gemmatimonadales bacterium]
MSFARWRASGGEAAVIGLARSGVAAGLLLRREGIPVYASDLAPQPDKTVGERGLAALRAAGATVSLGGHDLARIARAALCVVSPGVPPAAPPLQAARQGGVPIVSELDVGFAGLPGTRFAVITGTNGKTTTTALTGHLMIAGGLRTVTAGNIGRPLSQVALDGDRPEWVALEISSFQLHDTNDLVPTIGATTNLAPDHLDRYTSLDDYYADKDRLYLHANETACWVVNADDPEVMRRAEGRAGTQLRFSLQRRADAWYRRDERELCLYDERLISRDALALLGDHNVANALCAALVATRAGAAVEEVGAGLASFRPLPHRLEPVRTVDGVLWVNDSKATNVASTRVAVQALERPFVLLLGGRHKGEPYTSLADAAGTRCRAVLAYGESRELVVEDLGERLPVTLMGTDFAAVVGEARRLARPGDAVLLSPACSSYDMFQNYEERGGQFRQLVEGM